LGITVVVFWLAPGSVLVTLFGITVVVFWLAPDWCVPVPEFWAKANPTDINAVAEMADKASFFILLS